MQTLHLDWAYLRNAVTERLLQAFYPADYLSQTSPVSREAIIKQDLSKLRMYGVPRGGMCLVAGLGYGIPVVDPSEAQVIIDDIVDSGETVKRFQKAFPQTPFVAAITRQETDDRWVVFPWEVHDEESQAPDRINFLRCAQALGYDLTLTPALWDRYAAKVCSIIEAMEIEAEAANG
jgi:hypothetical protein